MTVARCFFFSLFSFFGGKLPILSQRARISDTPAIALLISTRLLLEGNERKKH